MKVMIVDDDIAHVEMLGMFLRTIGHQVETAVSGPRCIGMATLFIPDVVILDLQMPGMDGMQVARELRKIPTMRNCRIVLLTGAERIEPDALRVAGCDALIRKPAASSDILAALVRAPNSSVTELALLTSAQRSAAEVERLAK